MAKKKSRGVERIVGYGCSYTAGDELLDYYLAPGSDLIKRNQGMAAWREKYVQRRPLTESQLLRKQLSMSWVARLANLLKLRWDNRSIRGTSLAEHVYTIEKDRNMGKIASTDLILVGVTTPWRSCYFPEDSHKCHSYLFSMPDNWPKSNWHPETLLDLYTDRRLYLDHFLLQLRLAQMPRVYLVRMEDTDYRLRRDDPVLISRQQELRDTGRILGTHSLFSLIEDHNEEVHGGGHPKVEVHQRLAEHLEPLVRRIVSEL